MSALEVSLVPTEYIDLFWSQVEPLLAAAADTSDGRYQIEDVYDSITQYDHLCWVVHIDGRVIATAVTARVFYPRKTALAITYWAGVREESMEEWGRPLLKLLQRYAKELGCDCLEAHARLGWARRLKEYGYKKIFEAFELPVDFIGPKEYKQNNQPPTEQIENPL